MRRLLLSGLALAALAPAARAQFAPFGQPPAGGDQVIAVANVVSPGKRGLQFWHCFGLRKTDGSIQTDIVYGDTATGDTLVVRPDVQVLVPMAEARWSGRGVFRGRPCTWALVVKQQLPDPAVLGPQAPAMPLIPKVTVSFGIRLVNAQERCVDVTRELQGPENQLLVFP